MAHRKTKNGNDQVLQHDILKLLEEWNQGEGGLSRQLHRSKESVVSALKELQRTDSRVYYEKTSDKWSLRHTPRNQFFAQPVECMFQKSRKIIRGMMIACTHIGGRHFQPDLLKLLAKIANKRKLDFVSIGGDVCNSIKWPSYERGENFLHRIDQQKWVAIDILSAFEVPVFMINGNHHRWLGEKIGYDLSLDLCLLLNLLNPQRKNFCYIN